MAVFNSRIPLISRQVCKQLAVQRCVTTLVGQNWKFVSQNMLIKQNYSSVRCLSSSSSLYDVKQLADEIVRIDNEASPAEILANLSPEDEKRLKVLKLEYDVFMSTGVRVPDYVSDDEWVHLLRNCHTPSSRSGYYNYLFKREKSSANSLRVRTANRLAVEEKRKLLEQQKLDGTYEFMNTYQLRVREATMNRWYNNNLCYALMNGPHLVFDFSFEDQMNERELTNLIRQVRPADAVVTVVADASTYRVLRYCHNCN